MLSRMWAAKSYVSGNGVHAKKVGKPCCMLHVISLTFLLVNMYLGINTKCIGPFYSDIIYISSHQCKRSSVELRVKVPYPSSK